MKKPDIAGKVFEVVDRMGLTEIDGGPLVVPVADLAGLSLVPWYCDASVHWALRISQPGTRLKKPFVRKVGGAASTVTEDGAVLVGVPGDGIEPSTHALAPLAASIAEAAQPGMLLELAAANLGVVARDSGTAAETVATCGNQRYSGRVEEDGRWAIQRTTPRVGHRELEVALHCGRMVVNGGPWKVEDRDEARSVLVHWIQSPQASINPATIKVLVTLEGGEFRSGRPDLQRKLCGLGLGFFRQRLSTGPFVWQDAQPYPQEPPEVLEDVTRAVLGGPG